MNSVVEYLGINKGSGKTMAFLREKKARGERLNQLGEWLLSGASTGAYVEDEDWKHILR